MTQRARLIALDWGSSSLRAYLLGAQGQVLVTRASDGGASRLAGGDEAFAEQLRSLAGDWMDAEPGVPVLACGMVGSKHGWREAPYLECPTPLGALHGTAVTAEGSGGLRVRILPGVRCMDVNGSFDVMRGEETQVCGLLADHPRLARACTVVLPGTHSKWVQVQGGCIETFATSMTGELFTLLRQHSVLSRLMAPAAAFEAAAFDDGVRCAGRDGAGALQRHLFSVRTHGLFGSIAPAALADYLSGVLIGDEIAMALRGLADDAPLALAGEEALCERYRRCLAAFGRTPAMVAGNTAARGLWEQALQAGWVAPDGAASP